MKLLSIAIPVYNEELNVARTHARVTDVLEALGEGYDYEILFGDNASTDSTLDELRALAAEDPHVRVIRYSRNFGYQASVYTLTVMASGDAVIQLDADLQDPPELIPRMLELWEAGNEVVYGIRRSRQEGYWITQLRRLFYRLLDNVSDDELPHDAGDFRLVDRCVVDVLRKIRDSSPYIRGTIASMGFRQVGFEYDRAARDLGETHFSLAALVTLALDGLFNHSLVPLRLGSWIGAGAFVGALTLMCGYIIAKLFLAEAWPAGFTTIAVLVLLSIAINSLLLGILGEYIGRMYRQAKNRPVCIVQELINFEELPERAAGVLGNLEVEGPEADGGS